MSDVTALGEGVKPRSDLKHGGMYAYRLGCKCDVCRAGNTERARRDRAKRLAAKDADRIRHGTFGGYVNWGCRCDKCRAAQKESQADYRANRGIREEGAENHGRVWTDPERELLRRSDLPVETLAEMLGRSFFAVRRQLHSVRRAAGAAD